MRSPTSIGKWTIFSYIMCIRTAPLVNICRQKLVKSWKKNCDGLRTLRQKAAVVRIWPIKLSQTSYSFLCLESNTAEDPTHHQVLSATMHNTHSHLNILPANKWPWCIKCKASRLVKSYIFSVQDKYKKHFWFVTYDQEIPKQQVQNSNELFLMAIE